MILTRNINEIRTIKAHLHASFRFKDLGRLHVLGINVNYISGGIVLSQHKFTKNLLKEHTPDKKRQSLIPLLIHLKLSTQGGKLFEDPTPYRSIVGKLNYLTNTRPDLA